MNRGVLSRAAIAASLMGAIGTAALTSRADVLDDIGLRHLQALNPAINGSGITVAIVEAANLDENKVSLNDFQINPALAGITSPITYFNSTGNSSTSFPNIVGTVSSHATEVARAFGGTNGVATNTTRIYNYEASFFTNQIVIPNVPNSTDSQLRVINQSFVFEVPDLYDYANQVWDNYINSTGKIIVSAIGNGPAAEMPQVQIPATAYNLISVGALGISPGSTGTPDGRTKVDITAPGPFTSFTAPIVSGVATLLAQAGTLGLAGAGTQAASLDPRTVKSILLTGASKTNNWSHSASSPLDPQVGAGVVNAYSSYRILTGGKYTPSSRETIPLGGAHPAVITGTPVAATGWSLQNNSISTLDAAFGIRSSSTTDGVNHHVLTLPTNGLQYVFTATLTWNRKTDPILTDTAWGGVNNLDLFLYSGATAITSSTSTIDNVEHLYVHLNPGTYDLQVLKRGGQFGDGNYFTPNEAYALSWSASLLGDTNWDGIVDIIDASTVAAKWETAQRGVFNGDLNGDGWVNQSDFDIITANWQSGATVSAPLSLPTLQALLPVPEPAALTLLAAGALPLLLRRRR